MTGQVGVAVLLEKRSPLCVGVLNPLPFAWFSKRDKKIFCIGNGGNGDRAGQQKRRRERRRAAKPVKVVMPPCEFPSSARKFFYEQI